MGKTCVHRVFDSKTLEKCRNCKRDYNASHHPNNYDCLDYNEVSLIELEIKRRDGFVGKIIDYLSTIKIRIEERYRKLIESVKDAPIVIQDNKKSLDELLNKIM